MNKKFLITLVIILIVILIGIGLSYLYSKNNWGCALDSQGTKYYVLKSELNNYQDKTIDYNTIKEFKNKDVYAEDSNDCFGRHYYKVKNGGQLIGVDANAFSEYLSGEKFNGSFCSNGALIEQGGNGPFFVRNACAGT